MLSIVIPTYNEEEYLPFLLRSIQGQTYTDYEVIVADSPRTTDKTREIAAAFGARVVDGGMVADGRNNGAAAAKGENLLFLDADVVLPDPWFLQMTVAEFEKRTFGAATCKVHPLSEKKIDKVMHEAFNFFMHVTQETVPHAPGFCIFARKSTHDKIGGFDPTIKLAEDHDYVNRIGKVSKFGLLKTYKIPVSVRRFDRDGRLNIAVKYLLCELHMRTRGKVKSDIFNYSFGHSESKEEEKAVEKS
jgi:glycosyltransferase involved in cell wall biosynthesis